VNADDQTRLLEDLQRLLEGQLATARRGNYRHLEALAQQTTPVVEELRKSGAFENTDFAAQHELIAELYKKLELAVTGEKKSIENQQRQTADSKKTLRVYLNS
jgi:hypothetical protein